LNGIILLEYYEDASVYRTTNGGTNWIFQEFTGVGAGDVQMLNLNDAIAVGKSGSIASTITYHHVPVELSSFEIYSKNNRIYLYWSTSTETNNHGFEIERKNNDTWRTIAFISGHGTTSETNNYSYSDNLSDLIEVSSVWYRLKQVDYDGSFEYSKEIEVTFASDYSLAQNYPNPFNPTTTINYSLPAQGKVRLIVYDALGREVRKLVDEEKTAGTYNIEFNAEGLASGMYFYRLSAGEMVISKKMILLK
jgi:hypothetical protein